MAENDNKDNYSHHLLKMTAPPPVSSAPSLRSYRRQPLLQSRASFSRASDRQRKKQRVRQDRHRSQPSINQLGRRNLGITRKFLSETLCYEQNKSNIEDESPILKIPLSSRRQVAFIVSDNDNDISDDEISDGRDCYKHRDRGPDVRDSISCRDRDTGGSSSREEITVTLSAPPCSTLLFRRLGEREGKKQDYFAGQQVPFNDEFISASSSFTHIPTKHTIRLSGEQQTAKQLARRAVSAPRVSFADKELVYSPMKRQEDAIDEVTAVKADTSQSLKSEKDETALFKKFDDNDAYKSTSLMTLQKSSSAVANSSSRDSCNPRRQTFSTPGSLAAAVPANILANLRRLRPKGMPKPVAQCIRKWLLLALPLHQLKRGLLMALDKQSNAPTGDEQRRWPRGMLPIAQKALRQSLGALMFLLPQTSNSSLNLKESDHGCTQGCRFVRINVSGLVFEICGACIDRHPHTLLGDKSLVTRYWDPIRKEYFFDRHRPSFEGIFAYFKYGDLPRKPEGVPDEVFLDELYYFRVEDKIIDKWKASRGIPIFQQPSYILKTDDKFFRRLWYMFEFPAHSRLSYGLNIISVVAAIVAVCCLIFESMPNVASSHCLEDFRPNFGDRFFIVETICTAWFTFELLSRTIGSPTWRHLINYQTAIDIAANTPYYLILISVLISMDCRGAKASASTGFLRIFRLFSVFKLSDSSGAFALIANTFKASTRVLTLFFLALTVCVVLFGSFIYIIEAESTSTPQSEFQSIADGFWWAVITMTTVGYGDLIPRTFAGKLVGSCCAIVGVITLSMPIPILTENFNKFYKQMKKRKSMTGES